MSVSFHAFKNTEALNDSLAGQITDILQQAIAEKDAAWLVVSGGKTPLALFQLLSRQKLPWHKVTVLLADERWLAVTEPDSNEYMVKQALLTNEASGAHFISLYATADSAAASLPQVLSRLGNTPRFDVVLLGMGNDGHTASLFPCSKQLQDGLSEQAPAAVFISPENAPYDRISLSKNRLLNAEHLFLHLTGESKLNTFNIARLNDDIPEMPVRAFLTAPKTDISVMYTAK